MFAKSRNVLHGAVTLENCLKSSLTVSSCFKEMEAKIAKASTFAANLKLSTQRAQLDDKVEISVNGLREGQRVTLHSYVQNGDKTFGSCGHYIADQQGQISTFKQPSVGGTFSGLEPMGLFWSLDNMPNEKKARFLTVDPTQPYKFTIGAQEGFVDFENLPWTGDFSQILHQKLDRHHVAPGVRRITVEEKGLYGTLFLPPGEGPFPALIDIYGMIGGIKEHRAALMANHGFATFAIAYCNYKDLPHVGVDIKTSDLPLFLRAFDWLAAHPSVDSDAMGCLSSCVGGGYAMFLTAMRPKVRCLVTVNGLGKPGGNSQDVEGEYIHCAMMRPDRLVDRGGGRIVFKHVFRREDKVPVPKAWRHGAKFLIITGEDDQCVSPDLVEDVKESFPEEFRHNATFVSYPNAGHLIEPPYQPFCPLSYNKVFNFAILWGGDPIPHVNAQEDAWNKIVAFFKENLQENRPNNNAKSKL